MERKDSILALPEALLQFDKDTEQAYVEIEVGEQKFERKDIEIGISDGINVEVIEGITLEDKIKVWNKTEAKKKGEEETTENE